MHELLRDLSLHADVIQPDTTVKAAVIGAVALVLASAVTAFAATFQRGRHSQFAPIETELRRRAERAESECVTLERDNHRLRAHVEQLTELLLRHDIDPHTGKPFGGAK